YHEKSICPSPPQNQRLCPLSQRCHPTAGSGQVPESSADSGFLSGVCCNYPVFGGHVLKSIPSLLQQILRVKQPAALNFVLFNEEHTGRAAVGAAGAGIEHPHSIL